MSKGISIKYVDIKNFDFSNLIAKLSNTATTNNRANHIRHVLKEYNKCIDQISEEFKTEVADKFAVKDEAGKIVAPENDPNGFSVIEGQEEAFQEACKEFGLKVCVINYRPLTPDTLADVKLTPKELNLLGDLYTEENGPGVPHLQMQR